MSTNEPRALAAALSSPAFVTRGGGLAMHAANRHVSRWAPEVGEPGANRIGGLRNLGFVDRLVSPWIESAQRSPALRMFSSYITHGPAERPTSNVSWLFPRPWYQDELDWMAAARAVGTQTAIEQSAAPQMFTTRGTYVAPQQSQLALPSALYEYVAPSLSIARPDTQPHVSDAYSPLVPLAATHAAQVMARAMAPIMGPQTQANQTAATRMSPALRAVLATMLERSAQVSYASEPSRISGYAPELVTPPAPRPDAPVSTESFEQASQVAEQYAEQRSRIVELQRVARVAAEREYAAREAQQPRPEPRAADPGALAEVRAAEARAVAQRQAEIQQRAGDIAAQRGAVDAARREADVAANAAERQRLEQRIAERIAERTAQQQEGQRLHASARDAAARDARTAPSAAPAMPSASAPAAEYRMAAEVAAAVAALPPELASMVSGQIASRPERAAQAIAELGEALRAVELMARNTASGGTIEATRGPRLVMPAGLGGLVSTVERTTGERAQPRMPAFAAPQMPAQAPRPQMLQPMRVPAMAFLAAPGPAQSMSNVPAPTSALGAAAAATPAALSHVAWSDRWLARFAGAKTQTLDMLTATSAAPEMRLEMLAAAAPHTVFVAPFFDDRPRQLPAVLDERASAPTSTDVLPTLRNAAPSQPVARFADDAETPDEVFASIAAAAGRARAGAMAPAAPATPVVSTTPGTANFGERDTLADLVAHGAPHAPGAGLAAGLASSPFAPALRHVLPLGVAPTFDVRSLFGGGLGATYLAGLLSASTDEISIAAPSLPSWATWGETSPTVGGFDSEQPMRDVADWSPTYVAPELPRGVDAEGDAPSVETLQAQAAVAAAAAAPLTTLRSALLSWDVETMTAASGAVETRVGAPMSTSTSVPLARSMIEAMSLPMLADSAALRDVASIDVGGGTAQAPSYAMPGMIADRAQAWSVAQERSTADLAFDFVTPELVLAARVYGLGPAEAAQAARLAIAGPGQLTAMAGAVDRTFVQALSIESERRAEKRALTTAFPLASGETAVAMTPAARAAQADAASMAGDDVAYAMPALTRSTFGVERRTPRGAFLWPAATTAALGLNAASPDGDMSMSVAALELLAAQAVAELGTYAALNDRFGFDAGTSASATVSGTGAVGGPVVAADAPESDVLASAEAMVPTSRRDKFQALYLALGQTSSGRSASPAARAARALALAGRGDDAITPRERAAVAWDVLPMVYGGADASEQNLSTGEQATRMERRREELRALDPMYVDSRPGLGALSARAGEALGSYVAPSAAAASTSSSSSSSASSSSREYAGAVLRAPSAAQELIQTGRPAGRHGGGETEIPPWFEAAARKMLEERSSMSDGISLAELTLVQTAAPQQIAASSRADAGATHSAAPSPGGGAGAEKDKVDIEKLANEVYREIMVLMDIARARNGEPYL